MSRYFGPILTSPSPCHTSRDPPPKARHTSRNPPIFSSTCIHTYVFTGRFVLVCRGSCPECYVQVFFARKLCSGWFLSVPLLSEYIRYNRKLSLSILGFICMKKIGKV